MENIRKQQLHKHLAQGYGVRNYVPYMSTTQNQSGTQAQQGQQQNLYTPGQQGLQNNLGGLYQQLLGGNVPSSFTNPAAATNAYQSNFNTQVAPQLAANFGAGSPAIASQNALGLAQLQGNLYNTGVQNYTNALGQGANYALGMPTGATNTGTAAYSGQGNSTSNISPLALIASILGY